MDIKILKAEIYQKEILRNLMEKYFYEMSQYDNAYVNSLGLFGYDYLDNYWVEEGRFAYIIYVDSEIAGFSMINRRNSVDFNTKYEMAEFFITYPFRGKGVGEYVVSQIFSKHRGSWNLKCHPKNLKAKKFWEETLEDFSQGGYKIYNKHPKAEYRDGLYGDVFVFNI